jgi:ribose/xylose/arabinose/galactoside ABC-type transport system permease subunit
VLILGTLSFGMDMLGVLQQYQIILVGLLVIAAAIANEWVARRNQEGLPAARGIMPTRHEVTNPS